MVTDRPKTNFLTELKPQGVFLCVLVGGLHHTVYMEMTLATTPPLTRTERQTM